MDALLAQLPQHAGLLPKWLLFVSVVAIGNSVQSALGQEVNRQIYNGKPAEVTAVSSRTFAIWTLLSGVVRGYAAYYIDNPQIYQICLVTYVLAFTHFMSEWLVFGTAKWGRGLAGPAIVSTLSIVWMTMQRDFYVQA